MRRVYHHDYTSGYLTAARLGRHLEERAVEEPFFTSEMAGRQLQEAVFGPGARNDWGNTILGATGRRLDPDYFVTPLRDA